MKAVLSDAAQRLSYRVVDDEGVLMLWYDPNERPPDIENLGEYNALADYANRRAAGQRAMKPEVEAKIEPLLDVFKDLSTNVSWLLIAEDSPLKSGYFAEIRVERSPLLGPVVNLKMDLP